MLMQLPKCAELALRVHSQIRNQRDLSRAVSNVFHQISPRIGQDPADSYEVAMSTVQKVL